MTLDELKIKFMREAQYEADTRTHLASLERALVDNAKVREALLDAHKIASIRLEFQKCATQQAAYNYDNSSKEKE